MKKTLIALGIAALMAIPSFAEDWHYVGTFSAPASYDYTHDPLILDHLRAFGFQDDNDRNRRYFRVYYYHNHATDEGQSNEYVSWAKFNITGKVVPYDIQSQKESSKAGIYNAYVISNVNVQNKGAFGVMPQKLSAYDSSTNELLYEAKGNMSSETMWSDSAALYIINLSAPHPVPYYDGVLFGIRYKPGMR